MPILKVAAKVKVNLEQMSYTQAPKKKFLMVKKK